MICIGHRGAMGYAPENTLKSFALALELGASWVEADVHYVDDHLIVMHDERLERTTNGKGLLSEKSFNYLRKLDAGDGEKIPTLEELLDLIVGKAGINIELKGPGTAGPVIELIRERMDSPGNNAARTRCSVWVSWLNPSRARYSHCTGISTPSWAATNPFRVSSPSEGGQSISI